MSSKHLAAALKAADLAQPYEASKIEEHVYDWWEQSGFFKPRINDDRDSFVIAIPPPNVTGVLHTGHGLTNTIEDILVRWHRMLGDPTLWVPGTDHAGIATQNVVEKQLAQQDKTRHDLGREAFVDLVWEWKDRSHATISRQIRRLGSSPDWERERFTLDDGLSEAVVVAFKRLYDDGLIYRGQRLVNWCPRCHSAISDLEVVYRDELEQGSLWYIRYKVAADASDTAWQVAADDQFVTIATTRPETLLADSAIAVHPEDPRYQALIGKEVLLPVLGRRIPIIADEYVDREFGTGALKITPAHDPNDYEIGERHGLPMLNVMNENGTINDEGGPYAGVDRFQARKQIVEQLTQTGNLVEQKPHLMKIGRCERCDTIIEPLISTQWFVKATELAGPAMQAVRDAETQIVPERFEKVYFHWMEHIRDWCISRQLWWGHRIPVWYGPDGTMFVELNAEAAQAAADVHYGKTVALTQDEDVLDTWFSSGLWPFSILGWPAETEDFKRFYPTSVLETGYDILFFWVARMMMLGIYLTGKAPFHTVYLHGLVRDEQGRKMSKSLQNQVDPLDLIADFGTDAVRFTFATSSTPGLDFSLQPTRLEAAKSFANKLWNATRFVIMKLEDLPRTAESIVAPAELESGSWTVADRWVFSRFTALTTDVKRLMEAYNLGEAGRQIQSFFWDDFADWYIETAKIQIDKGSADQQQQTRRVLYTILEATLRLLHPFMPFVTEIAWQQLQGAQADTTQALMIQEYPLPTAALRHESIERDWELVQEAIRAVRNARSEAGVDASRWISALIAAGSKQALFEANRAIISRLARIADAELTIADQLPERPQQATTLVIAPVEVVLPLAGMVDLKAERARLEKELSQVEDDINRRQTKLANAGFVSKAPEHVVQKERDGLAAQEQAAVTLRERLASFE